MRTNISVDQEIAEALGEEASRENKTLYALVNEILSGFLKVAKDGGVPREIYPSWRFSRILKDTDAIPLPGSMMERITKRLIASDSEWLLKAWFEEGQTIGGYLKMYAEDFDKLVPKADELQGLLPVKRIEFEKLEGDGKTQRLIRVIGAGQSPESTSCTEQFLHGILSAYAFRIVSSKRSEGLIETRVAEMKDAKDSNSA